MCNTLLVMNVGNRKNLALGKVTYYGITGRGDQTHLDFDISYVLMSAKQAKALGIIDTIKTSSTRGKNE